MSTAIARLARRVLALPTAPFHEQRVQAFIRAWAARRDLPLRRDRYGNLVLRYRHGNRPRPVALLAHMDHPGFDLVDGNDYRWQARWLGGTDPAFFPGARLLLHDRDRRIRARAVTTVGSRAEGGRFTLETDRAPDDPDQAFGSFELEDVRIDGHGIVHTARADDLAGCVAILATIDTLRRRRATADLRAVFTRAEEVGFVGCSGLIADRLLPTAVPVVVLEASSELPGARIGAGPIIRVGDRTSTYHPGIDQALHAHARDLAGARGGFAFQRQLMAGGTCEASLLAAHDYHAGGLALPLGNYHNTGRARPACERIALGDLAGMVKLCTAFALKPPRGDASAPLKQKIRANFTSYRRDLLRQPMAEDPAAGDQR